MPKRTVAAIVGRRVRLRPLAAADLPRTLAWRNQDHVRNWFVHSAQLTWEQHQGWFERYLERDDDFLFVIDETDQLQKPIGQISLYRVDWQAGTAEYGRVLIGEPDAAGRGYASEATALLLEFAFTEWKLARVELEVFADNERALSIYHRCGFEPVGRKDGLLQMRLTPDRFARSAAGDCRLSA